MEVQQSLMKPNLYIGGGITALLLFGGGFLIGRQFPAHRYEKIASGPYLLDTSSGKVCFVYLDVNSEPGSELFKAFTAYNQKSPEVLETMLVKKPVATVPDCER
jgi:hypothetical protein